MAQCSDKQGALFQGRHGPLSEDSIARIVKKHATWARLEDVSPHVLRYTFVYTTGNDLVELADILGHDNVATTQVYIQKTLQVVQDEVEKARFF